jgi:proprotein convertase subtilisin/kexin type 1
MYILSKQWQIKLSHHTTEVISLFAGTRVQLLSHRQHDQSDKGFVNWKFMSVLSWGEQPRGTWVLDIIDEVTGAKNRRHFPYVVR